MIKLLIAGDLVFSKSVSSIEKSSYDTYFNEIKNIIDGCNYSIVNLESPIIKKNPTPINKLGPNLKADAKIVDLIKFLGFKGVTLANNHFYDQGNNGVIDTINECKKNSIDYFGAGINLLEAERTHYLSINGKKIAIINCCEIEFSIANEKHGGSNPLEPISQYYAIKEAKINADYVIVIVHGGIENFQYPTIRMQQTYRFFVDVGANAVINHHQHCFSGYETYKGAYIIYGTGNFFFPKPNYYNTPWNIGYIVLLTLNEQVGLQIYPYNQCSSEFKIELLNGKSKIDFEKKLKTINSIIKNREGLIQKNREFMNNSLQTYDWIFQPYENKYLKALAAKGVIPKFISQNKLDEVMSIINCSSHFDRFNFYLHSKTSKDI